MVIMVAAAEVAEFVMLNVDVSLTVCMLVSMLVGMLVRTDEVIVESNVDASLVVGVLGVVLGDMLAGVDEGAIVSTVSALLVLLATDGLNVLDRVRAWLLLVVVTVHSRLVVFCENTIRGL